MTIRESIRSQIEMMKGKRRREKLAYFWDYYGIKSICILTVLALSVFIVVDLSTQKDSGYVGVFFGASEKSSSDTYLCDFASFAGLDSDHFDITVQFSPGIRLDSTITEEGYQALEGFATMAGAHMVDNIAANADLFLYYSYLGYTADLRNVLSEAQLTELSPNLNYIDGDLLRQYQSKEQTIDYNHFPDPKKPDAMIDPIPVGIDLSAATEDFCNTYTFTERNAVIGICSTSERMDVAVTFIRFALGLK